MRDTGIHFSIIRNVDYFYTCKFNWIPVSSTGMTSFFLR
ncbi:MAG: WPE palindromic element domain-containing protein [Wolbachia sp.]